MFCPKCGNKIYDKDVYCSVCGYATGNTADEPIVEATTENLTPDDNIVDIENKVNTSPDKVVKIPIHKIIAIGLTAVVIFFAGSALVRSMSSKSNSIVGAWQGVAE